MFPTRKSRQSKNLPLAESLVPIPGPGAHDQGGRAKAMAPACRQGDGAEYRGVVRPHVWLKGPPDQAGEEGDSSGDSLGDSFGDSRLARTAHTEETVSPLPVTPLIVRGPTPRFGPAALGTMEPGIVTHHRADLRWPASILC